MKVGTLLALIFCMRDFFYTAYDSAGKKVRGWVSSIDKVGACEILHAKGLLPTSLYPLFYRNSKISDQQAAGFCRQLATMLKGGVVLNDAISLLEKGNSSYRFKQMMKILKEKISSGASFSGALSLLGEKMPAGLVEVGESAGRLEEVLDKAADNLERRIKFRKKIISALLYPAFVLTLSFLSLLFVIVYVLPTFSSMFLDLGVKPPFLTRLLLKVSWFLNNFWWAAAAGFVLIFFAAKDALKVPRFKNTFDRMVLGLPLVGGLLKKFILVRVILSFAFILDGGGDVLDALKIAAGGVQNSRVKEKLVCAAEAVGRGENLADRLSGENLFPPVFGELVRLGQVSGALPKLLLGLADLWEIELEDTLKKITSLVEPLATLVVGLVVGLVMTAMLLPLMQLVNAFQM